jgi:hypothetical protein
LIVRCLHLMLLPLDYFRSNVALLLPDAFKYLGCL